MKPYDALIVGAGIAGLCCAREAVSAGLDVLLVDKGRSPGGRMATRHYERHVFDHGTQFFTVRHQRFGAFVERWRDCGLAAEWSRGFPGTRDGIHGAHPRFRPVDGMASLAADMALDLDIHQSTFATQVVWTGDRWRVDTESGSLESRAVVLTPPPPQSLGLLAALRGDEWAALRPKLAAIEYRPCIAALVELSKPSLVPDPGGYYPPPGSPIDWIADNHKKGVSPGHAVTIHATEAFSREHLEDDPADAAQLLVQAAAELLGSEPVRVSGHRWRYSQPMNPHPGPMAAIRAPGPLAFAGDSFGKPRLEGAALSGFAAGDWLRAVIGGN
ncbi:MAG: FAD-dependent oxidoreductase [Candidatus Sumerlaeia bacterium]|nr:FAD-dependent oxidoreductase [Candidatus Sumerlaeia bacterium]